MKTTQNCSYRNSNCR